MELIEAKTLARRLMNEHGLNHWNLAFDRAVGRLGRCTFTTKTISLSRPLVLVNSESTIRNTILHEIAHALVGSRAGHGPIWRAKAISIGCTGDRVATAAIAPPAKWTGTCSQGHKTRRNRLTDAARRLACTTCCNTHNNGRWAAEHLFKWTETSLISA